MWQHPDNWAQRKLMALKAKGQSRGHNFVFLTSCIDCLGEDINAMLAAVEKDADGNELDVKEEMFANCDLERWADVMGYSEDFRLEDDNYVVYRRSTYQGCPCYYLDHSRIEYIWVNKTQWHPQRMK